MTESFQDVFMKYMNEMHFKSQQKAAKVFRITLILVAIISYMIAFHFQKFSICIFSLLIATAILIICVVPGQLPWWKELNPPFQKVKKN